MTSQQSGYRINPPPVKHSNAKATWMQRAVIVLGLAFVAAAVYGTSVTGQKNAVIAELTSVTNHLVSTQAELGSTRQTLASTQAELGNTKTILASTQTELSTTQQTLATTQTELGATRQTLATTQAELGNTKQTLTSTQIELNTTKQTLVSTQTELNTTKTRLSATQGELVVANTQLQAVTSEKNLMSLQYASLRNSGNARFGLTTLDRQRYVTPFNPAVNSTVINNWGFPVDNSSKMWQVFDSMYRWTVKNIMYSYDSYVPVLPSSMSGSITWRSDFWRTPEETLLDQTGDCEDMAVLLTSMMENYTQNKYAVWAIEIQSNVAGTDAHMAVAFPVAGGRLSIADPAGQYYTGIYQYNQLTSDVAASALTEWLSHWSQEIPNAYVCRIFSQSEDQTFSSNAEFLTWLSQR